MAGATVDVVTPNKESNMEPNVFTVVLTGMGRAEAAAADCRIRGFDQLAQGTAAMWTQYLASPSILAAMGFRVSQQSAGYPADTGTGTGGAK